MKKEFAFQVFKESCINKGYDFSEEPNEIILMLAGSNSIFLRKNTSDIDVCNQVLIGEVYLPVVQAIINNKISINTVLDCGSNIGLTSIYFKYFFPQSDIYLFEADKDNFEQSIKNVSQFTSIKTFNYAIWHEETQLSLDRKFRDKKEWSVQVKPVNTSDIEKHPIVQSITINEIISKFKLNEISLLKIDIEGAEKEIFTSAKNCEFLKMTKVLAIEIHDEYEIRESVYKILKDYEFFIINVGETTIGLNLKLCNF